MKKWEYLEFKKISSNPDGNKLLQIWPAYKINLDELKNYLAGYSSTHVGSNTKDNYLILSLGDNDYGHVTHVVSDYLGSLGWEAYSAIGEGAVTIYFKRAAIKPKKHKKSKR